METQCPACTHAIVIGKRHFGKFARCNSCNALLRIAEDGQVQALSDEGGGTGTGPRSLSWPLAVVLGSVILVLGFLVGMLTRAGTPKYATTDTDRQSQQVPDLSQRLTDAEEARQTEGRNRERLMSQIRAEKSRDLRLAHEDREWRLQEEDKRHRRAWSSAFRMKDVNEINAKIGIAPFRGADDLPAENARHNQIVDQIHSDYQQRVRSITESYNERLAAVENAQ